MGAVLHTLDATVGGDTLFCDMYAAYDGLPTELRAIVDEHDGIHDYMRTLALRPEHRSPSGSCSPSSTTRSPAPTPSPDVRTCTRAATSRPASWGWNPTRPPPSSTPSAGRATARGIPVRVPLGAALGRLLGQPCGKRYRVERLLARVRVMERASIIGQRQVGDSAAVVAAVIIVAALAVLVAIRVTGDQPTTEAGGATTTVVGASTSAPSTTVEVALDDPPSTATDADLAGVAFTDVTEAAGLAQVHSELPLKADMAMTSGAAVADIDADGDPDLYVTRVGRPNSLFRNNSDGTFTDIAAEPASHAPFRPAASRARRRRRSPTLTVTGASTCTWRCRLRHRGRARRRRRAVRQRLRGPLHRPDRRPRRHAPDDHREPRCAGPRRDARRLRPRRPPRSARAPVGPGLPGGQRRYHRVREGSRTQVDLQRTKAIPRGRRRPCHGGRAEPQPPLPQRRHRPLHRRTKEVGLPLDQIAGFGGQFVDMDGDGWDDLVVAGRLLHQRDLPQRQRRGLHRRHRTVGRGDGRERHGIGRAGHRRRRPPRLVRHVDRSPHQVGRVRTRSGNTGCSGNRLYLNDGDGKFRDETDTYGCATAGGAGARPSRTSATTVASASPRPTATSARTAPRARFTTDPMRLWLPSASGRGAMVEAAVRAGLTSTAVGHALVPFDYDSDGDLDILVANYGAAPTLLPQRHARRSPLAHRATRRSRDSRQPAGHRCPRACESGERRRRHRLDRHGRLVRVATPGRTARRPG